MKFLYDATAGGGGAPLPPEGGSQEQPGQQVEQGQQQPQYLTKEDLQKLGLVSKGDLETFGNSILQRAGDNTARTIKARLSEYDRTVKAQEKAGHPIPADQQAAVRESITRDVLLGEQQESPVSTPQAGQQGDDSWPRYVGAQIDEVFKEEGQEVEPGDPEWAALEKVLQDKDGSLAKVIRTATAQAQAKKTRLASEANTAAARAGGGGGKPIPPGDITQINDSSKLYELGEQQLKKGRQ